MAVTPKRRWYQFSLKTLMGGMFVFAILVAWITGERREASNQVASAAALESVGGGVYPDFTSKTRSNFWKAVLGDDYWNSVDEVDLQGRELPPRLLAHMQRFPTLKTLDLASTNVTDDDLSVIAKLKTLKSLKLYSTAITDKRIAEVSPLVHLEELDLDRTYVGNPALETIAMLPKLKRLCVRRTNVTEEGVKQFSQQRPDVEVIH